jgi:hypothetical protein
MRNFPIQKNQEAKILEELGKKWDRKDGVHTYLTKDGWKATMVKDGQYVKWTKDGHETPEAAAESL